MALIGGLDEVGWGSLAGPIISVVAVFDDSDLLLLPPGIKDSKQLTKKKMESLYLPICHCAADIGIGYATADEINNYNPYDALQLSYKRAVDDLTKAKPSYLIVDGQNAVGAWKGKQRPEPKADIKYVQVSAASIVAKVYRDRLMTELAKVHPQYGWEVNAGYGTEQHQLALVQFGMTKQHRVRYCRKFKKAG